MRPLVIFCLTFLALCACRESAGPSFPGAALALEPVPSVYDTWWTEMEACSGKTRPTRLEWYYMPWPHLVNIGTDYTIAAYFSPPDRIVIMEEYVDVNVVVRHEMLHALLRDANHPPEYFEERCGDLLY